MNSAVSEWEKLRTWLENNYPDHLKRLNPPTTDSFIKEIEEKLGYTLPDSLVELLKVNDGESKDSDGLFGAWRLLSVSEQLSMYKELRGDDRFQAATIHPFLMSGGGDYFCIDLNDGKVVEWWHEGGVNGEKAKNLGDFMKLFNQAVINGDYVVVDGFKGLAEKNDF